MAFDGPVPDGPAFAGPVWAIVVAAGTGSRFGRTKQFELLAGRPVAAWAVEAARAVVDGVVLVLPPGRVAAEAAGGEAPAAPAGFGADVVVGGGDSRSASVRAGLASVPDEAAVVVVHDAARPLASPALFRAVLDGLGDDDDPADGAVCAVPVADTLKRLTVDGTMVAGTVDRSGLVAVQTPQAFRAGALRRAHRTAADATDDAGLVEAAGGVVRVVPGDPRNLKLTTLADLDYAAHLLVEEVP
ncbi:MAG: 2-C-methyl-D-erythritol 4-phosphate cytidylyltransferase [Acidimicrobiales bacterium]